MDTNVELSIIALRLVPYIMVIYITVNNSQPRLAWAALIGVVLALLGLSDTAPNYLKEILRGTFAFLLLWHTIDIANHIRKSGGKK